MNSFTVRSKSEGIYKERGSRFISYLMPIRSEAEMKEGLSCIRSEHPKARHFCYAFKIGGREPIERSNDDGEPNGSAGMPILNQLRSAELVNALLVVVRYFGGTKLGVGGLNRAYKLSARNAIDHASIVKNIEYVCIRIQFPYKEMGKVKKLIERRSLKLLDATYKEPCFFTLCSSKVTTEELKDMMLNERIPDLQLAE